MVERKTSSTNLRSARPVGFIPAPGERSTWFPSVLVHSSPRTPRTMPPTIPQNHFCEAFFGGRPFMQPQTGHRGLGQRHGTHLYVRHTGNRIDEPVLIPLQNTGYFRDILSVIFFLLNYKSLQRAPCRTKSSRPGGNSPLHYAKG